MVMSEGYAHDEAGVGSLAAVDQSTVKSKTCQNIITHGVKPRRSGRGCKPARLTFLCSFAIISAP